jgi:hypothetical protein
MRKVKLKFFFSRLKESSRQTKSRLRKTSEKSRNRFIRIFAKNSFSKEPSRKTTNFIQIAIIRREFKFPSFPTRSFFKFSRGKAPSKKTQTNYFRNNSYEKSNKNITGIKYSRFTSGYSLTDWFGLNARQDNENIYISKNDLVAFGLVPKTTNSLTEILFCLNQIWISNKQAGKFSVTTYKYITLNEDEKIFAKESYLIKVLSIYNKEEFSSS